MSRAEIDARLGRRRGGPGPPAVPAAAHADATIAYDGQRRRVLQHTVAAKHANHRRFELASCRTDALHASHFSTHLDLNKLS